MDAKELLKASLNEMNIEVDNDICDSFMEYSRLLHKWNEVMNLTAITDEEEIVIKHFADSVSALKAMDIEKNATALDIGTGAGFPGLPVKIVRPDIKLTLVDSLNKRVNFLKAVCEELKLEDIECIHARAEELSRKADKRESFDYCLSRAVASLNVLCEYCLPFVKVGGHLIALKGPNAVNEVEDAKKAIDVLGGKLVEIKDISIPYSDFKHNLVIIKKVKQTPSVYPRKGSNISKKPL